MDKLFVSHAEYDVLCDRVVQSVLDSGWLPDHILGVSRGGLRLADALSRSLKVPMAVVAASSYAGHLGDKQGRLHISASIASVDPLLGRVLVVDDLVDTGVTLAALVAELPGIIREHVEIKTAVIWIKPESRIQPDFFAERLLSNLWIVQPFEVRDFDR